MAAPRFDGGNSGVVQGAVPLARIGSSSAGVDLTVSSTAAELEGMYRVGIDATPAPLWGGEPIRTRSGQQDFLHKIGIDRFRDISNANVSGALNQALEEAGLEVDDPRMVAIPVAGVTGPAGGECGSRVAGLGGAAASGNAARAEGAAAASQDCRPALAAFLRSLRSKNYSPW